MHILKTFSIFAIMASLATVAHATPPQLPQLDYSGGGVGGQNLWGQIHGQTHTHPNGNGVNSVLQDLGITTNNGTGSAPHAVATIYQAGLSAADVQTTGPSEVSSWLGGNTGGEFGASNHVSASNPNVSETNWAGLVFETNVGLDAITQAHGDETSGYVVQEYVLNFEVPTDAAPTFNLQTNQMTGGHAHTAGGNGSASVQSSIFGDNSIFGAGWTTPNGGQ